MRVEARRSAEIVINLNENEASDLLTVLDKVVGDKRTIKLLIHRLVAEGVTPSEEASSCRGQINWDEQVPF
jgi:hypothetical protein